MSVFYGQSHLAFGALQSAPRGGSVGTADRPLSIVAGATGVPGNEMTRRLVGSGRFAHTEVLASEPARGWLEAEHNRGSGPLLPPP